MAQGVVGTQKTLLLFIIIFSIIQWVQLDCSFRPLLFDIRFPIAVVLRLLNSSTSETVLVSGIRREFVLEKVLVCVCVLVI